jgi:hypothetical protein
MIKITIKKCFAACIELGTVQSYESKSLAVQEIKKKNAPLS